MDKRLYSPSDENYDFLCENVAYSFETLEDSRDFFQWYKETIDRNIHTSISKMIFDEKRPIIYKDMILQYASDRDKCKVYKKNKYMIELI